MASRLTDDEIHEVFTAFKGEDSDTLNTSELRNALHILEIDLTEEELADYQIDDDPDTLNEEEFTLYIRHKLGDIDCRQRCLDSLREFDEEGTGLLSRETMKSILTQRGTDPMSEEDADVLMNEFDKDGNGFDIEELSNLMYRVSGNDQEEGISIDE